MAEQRNVGTIDFNGIHRRINPTKLEISQFNEDENGSRYQDRTWRPRLGLCKPGGLGESQGNPITAISHFLGQEGSLHLTFVQGGTYEGFDQPDPDCGVGIVEVVNDLYRKTEPSESPNLGPANQQIDSHDGSPPGSPPEPPWEEEPPVTGDPPSNVTLITSETYMNEGSGSMRVDVEWDLSAASSTFCVRRRVHAFDITAGGLFTELNLDYAVFDDVGAGYTISVGLEDSQGNAHEESYTDPGPSDTLPVPAAPITWDDTNMNNIMLSSYSAGGVDLEDIVEVQYCVTLDAATTDATVFFDDLRVGPAEQQIDDHDSNVGVWDHVAGWVLGGFPPGYSPIISDTMDSVEGAGAMNIDAFNAALGIQNAQVENLAAFSPAVDASARTNFTIDAKAVQTGGGGALVGEIQLTLRDGSGSSETHPATNAVGGAYATLDWPIASFTTVDLTDIEFVQYVCRYDPDVAADYRIDNLRLT